MDKFRLFMYNYRMSQESPFKTPAIEYIGLVSLNRWWESEEHIRPVWKLYWNKNSGAKVTFSGIDWDITPEKIYLIAPMTSYVPYCRDDVEHFYIHFTLPMEYHNIAKGIWEINPGTFTYDNITSQSKTVAQSYHSVLKMMELIYYALGKLPEGFFEQKQTSILDEIMLWLHENLDGNCSNSFLSQKFNYSEDTLHRYFIKETGLSPQRYIRNMRISRGANLLKMTNETIEEIAEKCGFHDRSHFHRLFQKSTGISPAKYRDKAQSTIIHTI